MISKINLLLKIIPKVKSIFVKNGEFKLDRAIYLLVVLVVLMICNYMYGSEDVMIGLDLLVQFMTILGSD